MGSPEGVPQYYASSFLGFLTYFLVDFFLTFSFDTFEGCSRGSLNDAIYSEVASEPSHSSLSVSSREFTLGSRYPEDKNVDTYAGGFFVLFFF